MESAVVYAKLKSYLTEIDLSFIQGKIFKSLSRSFTVKKKKVYCESSFQ